MLNKKHNINNQKLLRARVPHNYVLWVASHFHPAMHRTSKILPCRGKRYCFVINGVSSTPLEMQISHGFFFFPGGYRNNNGTYNNIGNNGNWWSSAENDSNNAWNRKLNYNNSNVNRNNNNKQNGFSVRCVRDENRSIMRGASCSSLSNYPHCA
jgi:hypothetical protein